MVTNLLFIVCAALLAHMFIGGAAYNFNDVIRMDPIKMNKDRLVLLRNIVTQALYYQYGFINGENVRISFNILAKDNNSEFYFYKTERIEYQVNHGNSSISNTLYFADEMNADYVNKSIICIYKKDNYYRDRGYFSIILHFIDLFQFNGFNALKLSSVTASVNQYSYYGNETLTLNCKFNMEETYIVYKISIVKDENEVVSYSKKRGEHKNNVLLAKVVITEQDDGKNIQCVVTIAPKTKYIQEVKLKYCPQTTTTPVPLDNISHEGQQNDTAKQDQQATSTFDWYSLRYASILVVLVVVVCVIITCWCRTKRPDNVTTTQLGATENNYVNSNQVTECVEYSQPPNPRPDDEQYTVPYIERDLTALYAQPVAKEKREKWVNAEIYNIDPPQAKEKKGAHYSNVNSSNYTNVFSRARYINCHANEYAEPSYLGK